MIPGLIHDYGYRYAQLWKKDGNGDLIPYGLNAKRKYWDRLFRDIGENLNGTAIIDYFAWLAVRMGGCIAWKKRRKFNEPPQKPKLN